MNDTLTSRITSLSDDELVRLLTTDRPQYRDEAIEIARAEAAKRHLVLSPASPAPDHGHATLGVALRAFGKGVASQFVPGRFFAAEKLVVCPHCQGESFEEHAALVNTRGLTFFHLDWLDKGATVLACNRCGLVQWFRVRPERVPE